MNCNNPYNTNMGMVEPTNMQGMGYTNMPMGYPSNMGYMANPNMYGAGYGNMMMPPTSSCNQVVQKCFVEEIPYYVGYNTHAVSNLCYIKWSKNAKKVSKSVQNRVFLDKNCNFSPFTSSVYN